MIIEAGRKVLKKTAGNISEVYISGSRKFRIELSDGRIENCNVSRVNGMGLRIFRNKRVGFAYTTDFSNNGIDRLVQQATMNSGNSCEDEFNRLPSFSGPEGKIYDLYDRNLEKMSQEKKIDIIRSMERDALKYDSRIKKVLKTHFCNTEYDVAVLNSAGLEKVDRGTFFSAGIEVIAGDGKEIQSGWDSEVKRFISDIDFKAIVDTGCSRAVSLLGSRKVKSGEVTVILDPMVSCEFFEALSCGLCADSVQKGKSLFAGKSGKSIASSIVNLTDDGTVARGVGTSTFDAEGTPAQKTVLIKDGILNGYLYNDYTAGRDKVESTGNAVRSFKEPPGVGLSNLVLGEGVSKREDLLDIDRGIYVFEVLGMHTVDTVSGDFSVGISGMWVEKGKYIHPVSGVTMAGSIVDFLNSIDKIAGDARFYGNVKAPSIRVRNVALSGI